MNILCFGDSNTFGYDPRSFLGSRYEKPWPQILAEWSGWFVQNQGENGREIPRRQVNFSKDIHLLIIMLGTNDLLQGNSVEITARKMEVFLRGIDLEKSKLLLIGPPSMRLGAWISAQSIVEASRELVYAYSELSRRLGIRFLNADDWDISLAFDGVHFTEEGHRVFASAIYQYLNKGD